MSGRGESVREDSGVGVWMKGEGGQARGRVRRGEVYARGGRRREVRKR